MSTINFCNHDFTKGDKIEILRNSSHGHTPAWFPATIIDSPSPSGTTLHVKFTTLFIETHRKNGIRKRKKIREYVNVSDGVRRPIPPLRFLVRDNRNVRVCDWEPDDGSRVCSIVDPPQEKSTHDPVSQSTRPTKLRIICRKPNSKAAIVQKGARVEVRTDEEGYHGARYVATVVGSVGEDKVLVQYDTLTTDDQMQQLVEMVYASNLRPIPSIPIREHRFNVLEEVDSWYNDGWWVGVVTKVLTKFKYVVYFWTTNEEIEFHHLNLRAHQEFVNEKWVASVLKLKLPEIPILEKMKLQTGGTTLMKNLLCGLNVEIAHGIGRYLSTWYPAVILGPVSNRKYLVKYRTLKSNNGPELVEEEVDVLSLRPAPPIIQRDRQFKPSDAVDAWDVNRWRIGEIIKTMDFKYEVYFWGTNAVVEFQHAYLRPHQDFVDGAWLGSYNNQE